MCLFTKSARRGMHAAFFWAFNFFIAAFVGLGCLAARADTVLTPPIPVDLQPMGVAITPDGKFAFVTNTLDSGTVSVIDMATNTVVGAIPVSGVVGASLDLLDVAITPDGKFAYVTSLNNGSVYVIDVQKAEVAATQSTAVVGRISMASGPWGVAIKGTSVYVAMNGSGGVQIIDTTTQSLSGGVTTGGSPTAVAISSDGKFLYVTGGNLTGGTVTVIDTTAGAVVGAPIAVGGDLEGIALTPDGKFAYVTNFNNVHGTVSVIDTATRTVVGAPITVGAGPLGIAVTPDGKFAYVTNQADGTVSVIDTQQAQNAATQAGAVVNTLTLPAGANGIKITSDGKYAYVANLFDNSVSVIALGVTMSKPPNGFLNTAYTGTIKVSDASSSTFTLTTGAASLPPGLTLDPATGKITGVPTALGSYTFTVAATSTVRGLTEQTSQEYTIQILNAVATAPIPALSEMALLLLALLLGVSAVVIRRRWR